MLSKKIKELFNQKGSVSLTKEEKQKYIEALVDLNIPLSSIFAEFNLSTIGPTFNGRKREIYNVCWFKIYSNDLDYAIESARNILKIPEKYLPLDSFEGEGGFFYNKETGEVVELELGEKLINFQKGIIDTKWNNINEFLEWYFELN